MLVLPVHITHSTIWADAEISDLSQALLHHLILGFHSCYTDHENGCYPPSLCPSNVKKSKARVRESRWPSVLGSVAGEKA